MIGNKFLATFHVPGTLAADVAIKFKAEADMTLKHVSSCISNAGDTRIKIGNSDDDDAYLALNHALIGESGSPAEIDRDDFVGGQYPHISKGTIVTVDVDYDGASGTAGANLTLVLTFTEG